MRASLPAGFFTVSLILAIPLQAAAQQTAAPQPAPTAEQPVRQFATFATDAETARGLWLEVGEVFGAENDFSPDVDVFRTNFLAAYGQERWEAGALIPFTFVNPNGAESFDGWGDLGLYGKFLAVRTERFTFGPGLGVFFPTGESGFTTDEYGFQPFLTAGVECGRTFVRSHIGYVGYTGDGPELLDYSGSVLLPLNDILVLRTELVGQHYFDGAASGLDDPVTILPGVDLRAVDASWQLMFRFSAGAGITDEAPDYQFGISLAVAQAAG